MCQSKSGRGEMGREGDTGRTTTGKRMLKKKNDRVTTKLGVPKS